MLIKVMSMRNVAPTLLEASLDLSSVKVFDLASKISQFRPEFR